MIQGETRTGDLLMRAQLAQIIHRYLIGELRVQELEDWLVSQLQRILDGGDRIAMEIADEVDADLVWFGERLISEKILRDRLWVYLSRLNTINVIFEDAARVTSFYTTTASQAVPVTVH